MTDEEFLQYCDTHAESPRCGFVPEQISRLLRLAGEAHDAALWDAKPLNVYNCDEYEIKCLVKTARQLALLTDGKSQ